MTHADATALLRSWGDRDVMGFMARPPLADRAASVAFIDEIAAAAEAERLLQWGVVPDGEDEIVGTVTLVLTDRQHETADVGYAIERARWGEGLATRAVGTVVAYAFEVLGLYRLQADVDPRNVGSARVLDKLGFSPEGLLRGRYLQLGERQDAVIYGLLATQR